MDGRLLNIDEVAQYLGVHRDTVYALVRSGKLPALQLGGRKAAWRVTEEDLDAFVGQRRAINAESLAMAGDRDLARFDRDQEADFEAFRRQQQERRKSFIDEGAAHNGDGATG